MGVARAGRGRAVAAKRPKKIQNFEILFGRLPQVLPARENRISTQGAVPKILRKVICPYGACLVCTPSTTPEPDADPGPGAHRRRLGC